MAIKEVIIIGWINSGKPADCGETMKNQLLIQKLESLGVRCIPIDFKNWKKHPWVYLKLFWNLLFHRSRSIIFSTSTKNVYPMMKMMKNIRWKQHSILWVIGGALGENTMKGVFDPKVIDYMDWILVESKIMVEQLNQVGVDKVIHVPNFKPIKYYPNIDEKLKTSASGRRIEFVFLSRIMPEKGCDYIIESARKLNKNGLEQKYQISFYGKIDDSYKNDFIEKIQSLPNAFYKGFLNLRENSGLDEFSKYDVMLFPTYWKGEGFAGVFMDSFICGVPMIVSDWAHNRQFMKENETAIFVPVHDVAALTLQMRKCIEEFIDLNRLSRNCQKTASMYDIDNVVTENLLTKIGLKN